MDGGRVKEEHNRRGGRGEGEGGAEKRKGHSMFHVFVSLGRENEGSQCNGGIQWYAQIKITGKKPIIYYLKIFTLLWITYLQIVTLDFVQVYILS
jgi:hypothetical protein